jgi:lipid-binding SYLF domain-containing protein
MCDAEGIAIVPGLLKGGFVIGVRHGRGVLVVRDESGAWRAPVFITITGGSIGWQAGVQATDVVLVFKTKSSVQGLMNGKFTIGGDVAAAAGPVGRQAQAATDARLKAEIYSYSRSRGLFAGVSLDGSAIQMDPNATAVYYASYTNGLVEPGQPQPIPPSAQRLMEQILRYTARVEAAPVAVEVRPSEVLVPVSPPSLDLALADSARRLAMVLDDRWKAFLIDPVLVETANGPPSANALQRLLDRYNAVAANPQYAVLSQRPEFQETYRLLQQLASAQAAPVAAPTLPLPAPPGEGR